MDLAEARATVTDILAQLRLEKATWLLETPESLNVVLEFTNPDANPAQLGRDLADALFTGPDVVEFAGPDAVRLLQETFGWRAKRAQKCVLAVLARLAELSKASAAAVG